MVFQFILLVIMILCTVLLVAAHEESSVLGTSFVLGLWCMGTAVFYMAYANAEGYRIVMVQMLVWCYGLGAFMERVVFSKIKRKVPEPNSL